MLLTQEREHLCGRVFLLLYRDQRWHCTVSSDNWRPTCFTPDVLRTDGTFTTARRCCGVFMILMPDTKLQTYLLTYLLTYSRYTCLTHCVAYWYFCLLMFVHTECRANAGNGMHRYHVVHCMTGKEREVFMCSSLTVSSNLFTLSVKSWSSLIKKQYFRIPDKCSCYRNTLLLTTTQLSSLVTNVCLIFLPQTINTGSTTGCS